MGILSRTHAGFIVVAMLHLNQVSKVGHGETRRLKLLDARFATNSQTFTFLRENKFEFRWFPQYVRRTLQMGWMELHHR